MPEWFSSLSHWLLSLVPRYGVNPTVFAVLYVGSIPFFAASLGWTAARLRSHRPAALPALLTGFFFLSADLYVLAFGHGLPLWVYLLVVLLVGIGGISVIQKLGTLSEG